MMASEYTLPRIFDAHMGDCQYPFVIIMQISDLLGVTAVTGLIYLFNVALCEALEGKYKGLKIATSLIVLSLVYGGFRMSQVDKQMHQAQKLKIGMVEGDVGIFESEPRQKSVIIY